MKTQDELGLDLNIMRTRKKQLVDGLELVGRWRKSIAEIAASSSAVSPVHTAFSYANKLRIHFSIYTRRLLQTSFGDVQLSANMYTAC